MIPAHPLPRRAPAALVLAALALAACAGARSHARPAAGKGAQSAAGRRAFTVPGHGALEIAVPPGWTAEAIRGEPPAPVTVRLEPPGGAFRALLTPFWNPGEPEDEPARADTARLLADIARRNALAGSVERELPLEELSGDGVHGFWFTATDRELVGKEPGPEEWHQVLQGAAAVGPLVVAFTLLDDGPGPQREAVLEVVRGARHVAEGEAPPRAGGMELDPDAETVPLRVAVEGRAWAVLVDLPGFRMFKPRRLEDRPAVLVLGQHPESGVVVSVILREDEGAATAEACRDADLAKLAKGGPELVGLAVSAEGGAARAAYAVAEVQGKPVRQEHAHAWLHREGVCANVHVSKAEAEAEDAWAMRRILESVRFGEDL